MNVSELIKTVNNITPFELAFEDDKVGLLIGSEENDVSGVLIAHDLENSILEQLDNNNINTAGARRKARPSVRAGGRAVSGGRVALWDDSGA